MLNVGRREEQLFPLALAVQSALLASERAQAAQVLGALQTGGAGSDDAHVGAEGTSEKRGSSHISNVSFTGLQVRSSLLSLLSLSCSALISERTD